MIVPSFTSKAALLAYSFLLLGVIGIALQSHFGQQNPSTVLMEALRQPRCADAWTLEASGERIGDLSLAGTEARFRHSRSGPTGRQLISIELNYRGPIQLRDSVDAVERTVQGMRLELTVSGDALEAPGRVEVVPADQHFAGGVNAFKDGVTMRLLFPGWNAFHNAAHVTPAGPVQNGRVEFKSIADDEVRANFAGSLAIPNDWGDAGWTNISFDARSTGPIAIQPSRVVDIAGSFEVYDLRDRRESCREDHGFG